MPTAVERLTSYLTRVFSLTVVEGAATQQLFATLDTEIDTAVGALMGSTTASQFAAAESQYSLVFTTFGSDGLNFKHEFDHIGRVLGRIDDRLGGSTGATTGAQADFLAFDKQLMTAGAGLGAFGVDMYHMADLHSQAGLVRVVTKTAGDTGALQGTFSSLSDEAAALVTDLESNRASSGDAALVTALKPLVGEFSALATDFGNFTTLLSGNANSASPSGASNPLTFDGVFASLDADFIALDKSFQGLAAPIANLLVHPSAAAHP